MMNNNATSFNDATIRTLPQMRNCASVNGRVQSTASTPVSVLCKPRCDLNITVWDNQSQSYLEFPKNERIHSWTTTLVSFLPQFSIESNPQNLRVN